MALLNTHNINSVNITIVLNAYISILKSAVCGHH